MLREVERGSVLARPVADSPLAIAAEIQTEKHAVAERKLACGYRVRAPKEQRISSVVFAQFVVGHGGAADREPDLIQRQVGAHPYWKREWNDFEVEVAVVSRLDLVEPVAVVGDDAREDVDAAGGALRVRLRPDLFGQAEALA